MEGIRTRVLIAALLGLLATLVARAPGVRADGKASPPARLLLLHASAGPDQRGFDEQLRIQLGASATIVTGPELDGATPGERIDQALQATRDRGAPLAVWLETAPAADGGTDYLLYLVGDLGDHAQLEVFRIPAGNPADRERALALKAHAAFESINQELIDSPPGPHVVPEIEVIEPPPPAVGRPAPAGPRLSLQLEAGGDGVVDRLGTDGQLRLGLGLRASRADARTARGELALGVALAGGGSADGDAGHVDTSEWSVWLTGRWLWPRGRVRLGPTLALGAHRVHASGVSIGGARGETTTWVPELALGGAVRIALGPRLELGAGVALGWRPREQTFSLNHEVVAELGHASVATSISLVFLLR